MSVVPLRVLIKAPGKIMKHSTGVPEDNNRPRLFVYSFGLLFQKRVRKILKAHGWRLRVGLPLQSGDKVAVWGRKKVAKRGIAIARYFQRPLVTVEDAFLRSVLTGRQGAQSLGIVVDEKGVYFDTSQPSDMDDLLAQSLNISAPEKQKSAEKRAFLNRLGISKYNDFSSDLSDLPKEYVLVIDQTVNDASITKGGGNADSFVKMLSQAKAENPNAMILIKIHPETLAGKRQGHFSKADCSDQISLLHAQVPPSLLFEKALKIYCVTSQVGLEAIFAGHAPVVFGCPFYSGLGLTDDRGPIKQTKLKLSADQLFWATHLQYSNWYDPYFDCSTDFINTAHTLYAQARQNLENKTPAICIGIRLWKRGFFKRFLSNAKASPTFTEDMDRAVLRAKGKNARIVVWGSKSSDKLEQACTNNLVDLVRVEDGFLRSVGLGAELTSPVSLAFDSIGIYYDPTRPSQLENLINQSTELGDIELARAKQVREHIVRLNLTKYNLDKKTTDLTPAKNQHVILVPGQVEDDASIIKGADTIKTNLDLVKAVRRDFPDAYIVYKPHPDVEAGLRQGAINPDEANRYTDVIANESNMADLLMKVDRVATITSLAGFEALLRGKKVTCYGAPFYAGWGLTDDKAPQINRRKAKPSLDALVHACLIDYPRYWDPVTQTPCPIEAILKRFERGEMRRANGPVIRLLSKAQGLFASYAYLWR